MVLKMAMISPATAGVGGDPVTDFRTRLYDYRVLAWNELVVSGFEIAPDPVQMHGVIHHGVIHQGDAQAFAILHHQRFSISEFDAVD